MTKTDRNSPNTGVSATRFTDDPPLYNSYKRIMKNVELLDFISNLGGKKGLLEII